MNTLRLQFRFIVPLFLVITLAAYFTVPLVDQLSLRWTMRDLNSRSHLIANTISDNAINAVLTFDDSRLESIFNRVIMDERVLGVGLCDREGKFSVRTAGFPEEIDCRLAEKVAQSSRPTLKLPNGSVHIAVEPLSPPPLDLGKLVLLHDLSYAEKRGEDTRRYLILFFVVLGSVIAAITVITAHLSLRGWLSGVRALLRGKTLLKPSAPPTPELQPLAQDLRAMLRELEEERRYREIPPDMWTPEKLRDLLSAIDRAQAPHRHKGRCCELGQLP